MNLNKKLAYSIAGAAIAAVSTAMIVDYACRKAKEKTAYTAILVAGLAGLAAGTALGTLAVKEAKAAKKAALCEDDGLLEDCEVEMIEDNIAEVLGGADEEEPVEAEVIEAEAIEAEAVEAEAVEAEATEADAATEETENA